MNTPDLLTELFRLQKQLNERIGVHVDRMTEPQRREWLPNYCRAMQQEVAELTDSVPGKWWAKYQAFDVQTARVEVVDLLDFLISAAQVLEMPEGNSAVIRRCQRQVHTCRFCGCFLYARDRNGAL